MAKVALFGTSADPPHRGHRAILQWLARRFDQVAVWAADNPFKAHQTALNDRAAMLSLLIQDLEAPHQNVQLYPELSHSRTLFSVEQAQQVWPQAELYLAIGADLVQQLPRWYRAAEILRQVNIVIFPRPGYTVKEQDLAQLRQLGAAVTIAEGPELHDVSSTEYRQCEDNAEVPTIVQAYIDQNDLYLCPENSKEKLPTRS
ncbi:MAG: nicotinate-nucleotide adenylyltransferase [Leptolyngbyaceae cyanobacterium SM1_1_3]|nr:nicotinate-nucleotide adenylyltransferase [Leptolyngbyaceae cyanobacterium SM1_1_3]NJN04274.1 nicotinate-nucleotide adenylyltransferase [Leptolyngbyaceae cyanobacterium RM1_1_2]NJO08508.1 nicotinate-nucleotide adenylyltransferase [Leptolyngbyaceae cyanobacterium SL_1_1]